MKGGLPSFHSLPPFRTRQIFQQHPKRYRFRQLAERLAVLGVTEDVRDAAVEYFLRGQTGEVAAVALRLFVEARNPALLQDRREFGRGCAAGQTWGRARGLGRV